MHCLEEYDKNLCRTDVKHRKFDSTRRFGVELEVSNTVPKTKIKKLINSLSSREVRVSSWGKDNNNDYWHIKDDTSCGPKGLDGPAGYEIVSYVGSGINDIIKVADVADLLLENKVDVTPFCGYHIHIDASDLLPHQVGTIIAYWLKVEYMLGMALPQRRRGNMFCQYVQQRCRWAVNRNQKHTAMHVWDLFKPENLSDTDNDERRVTLNLVNYARCIWYKWATRKTLELRWPEGTLDGRNVKNWLRLFLHFIETVKYREMPEDLQTSSFEECLKFLGLQGEGNEFFILSEGLMDTKTWLLERMWYFLHHEGNRYGRREREKYIASAKKTLNHMWAPETKYSSVEDIYPYEL